MRVLNQQRLRAIEISLYCTDTFLEMYLDSPFQVKILHWYIFGSVSRQRQR